MAQKHSKNSSARGKKKQRWRFELGPFGMLGVASIGVLVMAWAFILGILVGRGYHPESVIPEIGRIVAPQMPSFSSPPTVLQPEELRFFETLQERGSQPVPVAPRRTEPQQASLPDPRVRQPGQQMEQDPLRGTSARETPPAIPGPESAEPRFEFVYQVASFQSETQARSLQNAITSMGLPATLEAGMVNGRQWYRVMVTVRGGQEEADQAKARLRGLGIADPFLRAKKSL